MWFGSLCTRFDFADLILRSVATQLICKAGGSEGAQQSDGFEAKLQIVRIFGKRGEKKNHFAAMQLAVGWGKTAAYHHLLRANLVKFISKRVFLNDLINAFQLTGCSSQAKAE